MDNNNNNFPISSSNSTSSSQQPSSLSPKRKKTKRKRRGMINPSLTYAEYNFLKDLANGKVDDDGTDKYSDGYKRLLKHRLRRKFPVVMEMAEMMRKVREEKKI